MCGFCNIRVCVCVGFVMFGFFCMSGFCNVRLCVWVGLLMFCFVYVCVF